MQVVAQILGESLAPWVGADAGKTLLKGVGKFRAPVLSLLQRDPSARPSISAFMQRCNSLLASTSRM
jgi:hypothetical protein